MKESGNKMGMKTSPGGDKEKSEDKEEDTETEGDKGNLRIISCLR